MKRPRLSKTKEGIKRPRLVPALNTDFQTSPVQTIDEPTVPAPKPTPKQVRESNSGAYSFQRSHTKNVESSSDPQLEIIGDVNDTEVLNDPQRDRSQTSSQNTPSNDSPGSSFDDTAEPLKPFVTIVESDSDDDSECEEIQVTTHEEKDSLYKRSTKSLREFECPICFDVPGKTIGLACGHVYCFGCLFEAFSHSSERKANEATCALCRKKFTLLKTIPLIFKTRQKEISS